MTSTPTSTQPKKSCCICCVSEDAGWGDWFVREIDAYRVPRKLIGHINRRGERLQAQVGPVHLLQVEAEAGIGEEQRKRLTSAGFLIIVCSKPAAKSAAMGECLRYFKSIGRSDRIIAAIVEGVPGASGPMAEEECFHEALRYEVDQQGSLLDVPAEPLAADFRVEGKHPGWYDLEAYAEALEELGRNGDEVEASCQGQEQRIRLMRLKLLAGILGLNLGELTERDKAYQSEILRRRVLKGLVSSGVLALLVFAAIRGAMVLKDYRLTAAKAAEDERLALARSSQAEQERRDAEARNLRHAESLRLTEEKARGLSYMRGDNGLPKDRALALRHLAAAASGGDAGANLWLAKLLVDKPQADAETAAGIVKLIEVKTMGAQADSAEAAYHLGRLHAEGRVVNPDRAKAVEYSEFAASRGYVPAMEPLAYMLERGWGGQTGAKMAFSWYERAAAAESPEGLFALYLIYLQGRPAFGIIPDPAKSAAYLSRAAKAGEPRALYQSSLAADDPTEIEALLERAAKGGESRARHALVRLYLGGERGHAVVVEKGIFHAGLALESAIQGKDINKADTVAEILAQTRLYFSCGPIKPQLMKAALMGSANSAFVYAMSSGMGEDGKLKDLGIFKSYMLKAAEAGVAEAQYELGTKAMDSLLPDVSREAGAAWVELAAGKGYPPALVLAAQNRRDGGLLPKDWRLAADLMKKASQLGKEVDWSLVPRRFRPAEMAGVAIAPAPSALQDQAMPEADKMAEAVQVIAGKAKRSKESVDFVLKTFPLNASWSEERVGEIGVMLMSVGRYDEGVAYLARAVLRSKPVVSHNSARTLANYFEATRPAAAYQWYLVAQSRVFERTTEIFQGRIKISEAMKEAALASASLLVAQDGLESAAQAAGLPGPGAAPGRKVAGNPASLATLLAQADALLAKTEFPEEAEDAKAKYEEALSVAPGNLAAITGLFRANQLLGLDRDAHYWRLRYAHAKRSSSEPAFECCVELAGAYSRGSGVAVDLIESAKWLTLARAELGAAEALASASMTGAEAKAAFVAAKKLFSELESARTVGADDPALKLRLRLYRAYLSQASKN